MSHVFPFTASHFHLALVAASISHFVTAATKFSCCSSNKKMSPLFFISRSRSLSPFFSLSFAGLPPTFSFSLSFSCSIFQICGHDNLSKLNTLDNTDTETISAFRFCLYWHFCCVCFTRLPAKITLSCIWVTIPVDWVILHWYTCGAEGLSGGRCTVTWLPNFLGWVKFTLFSYPWCSAGALRTQELLYKACIWLFMLISVNTAFQAIWYYAIVHNSWKKC